jgi:hypothetical protein
MKFNIILVAMLAGLAMTSGQGLPKTAKVAQTNHLSYNQVMKVKDIGCTICTFVVGEIDKILQAEESMDAIIGLVEELCNGLDSLVPGAGASCNSLVERYLPQIIDGLVNNQLSPTAVCGSLTLC